MHCSEVGSGYAKINKMPLFPHTTQGLLEGQVVRQWGRGSDATCGVVFRQLRRSKNIQGHTGEMETRLINLSQQLLRLTGIEVVKEAFSRGEI